MYFRMMMSMTRAIAKGTMKEKEFPPIEEDSHRFLIRVMVGFFMEIIYTLNICKIPEESRGNDNKKGFPRVIRGNPFRNDIILSGDSSV